MQLKEITFKPDSEGQACPATVTVEMTVQEALWVAVVSGQQKGQSPHCEIFNGLVGDVFNRYWDDGVDGARREFPIEILPINYDS